ncbi:short chain dehydrogenase [Renibacterium salmoninarum ATCC 33209]|uniref:Short chain dehydrogenase n=1 Tax=Renibacterium salmoninarum (strain ATCC 33209 / DSM 20767 / JCM 11484 / NBRC 15589 / NCIMB 2235) TaxID=288705 RepID=A9WUV4_RENSM|nr:SDR family oxidoreductase [Renibacterium salmoninarum]ABY24975.1 short chain dehydrogenase [Renibacterium salmoninarum ATCC 33209]
MDQQNGQNGSAAGNLPGEGARRALVTGASTGIGEATARALASQGWTVFAVARRLDRLEKLAAETGVVPLAVDITNDAEVVDLLATISAAGGIDTLIDIAGGARGADRVGAGNSADWDWMFRTNVLGTLNLIKAFLPMLRQGRKGTVLNLTSTAALVAYEGGAGYNAAKFGQRAMTQALRLEEAEHNLRVIEVLPGMVQTEEFALNRLSGDAEAAQKVYQGVTAPLVAEDVAEVVRFAVSLPHHVNLDEIVMRPVAQAAAHKVIRES